MESKHFKIKINANRENLIKINPIKIILKKLS